jgi:hypothetical protein
MHPSTHLVAIGISEFQRRFKTATKELKRLSQIKNLNFYNLSLELAIMGMLRN